MKINNIHIRNFRKLKNCRIDFDEQQTILVGANNSGKTSAISSIVWFLANGKNKFSTREFTLTNWKSINEIGDNWIKTTPIKESLLNIDKWDDLVPSLDVWIDVNEDEVHLVYQLLPSLSWNSNIVGFRVRFEPIDANVLYRDFQDAINKAETLKSSEEFKKTEGLELFPKSLWDFLNKGNNLGKYFGFKYYVLDYAKCSNNTSEVQKTPSIALEEDPSKNLIRIDSILAFREFSDPEGIKDNEIDTLSKQLQEYYRIKNNDEIEVETSDLELMAKLIQANQSFEEKLQKSFQHPIRELKSINYPGFQNPDMRINGKINIENAISHESAVQFAIKGNKELSLPEKYNGLGYRNLISIYFRLIQFRENWIEPLITGEDSIPPIHLVFIEEPEAHLHAQAQQVFIRKAIDALNENEIIKSTKFLNTQLVVSTHSNHIINELDIKCLRYFKRIIDPQSQIPISSVVNLSRVFGTDEETRKFVTRYIRLTHCDIFFADAAIFIEGSAERMLMPLFLHKAGMDSNYISIIEINGNHAYRFRPLIEKLQIPTLIVTDIDASQQDKSIITDKGKGYKTNNETIKKWLANMDDIDKLLELPNENKIIGNVRIAYQTQIDVIWSKETPNVIIYPYTFEDALIFSNLDLFRTKEIKGMGPATTIYNDCKRVDSAHKLQNKIFNQLDNKTIKKAELANILLYEDIFEDLKAPSYIKESLQWLKNKLEDNADE